MTFTSELYTSIRVYLALLNKTKLSTCARGCAHCMCNYRRDCGGDEPSRR